MSDTKAIKQFPTQVRKSELEPRPDIYNSNQKLLSIIVTPVILLQYILNKRLNKIQISK